MTCSYTVVLMRLIIINNQMSDEFHSPLTLILFFNICVSISCHGSTHSFIYPESDCRVFYLKLEWLRSGSAAKDFVKWVDDHNLGRVSLQERGKQLRRTRWKALVRRSMTRGRLQIASAKHERLVRRFGRSACHKYRSFKTTYLQSYFTNKALFRVWLWAETESQTNFSLR